MGVLWSYILYLNILYIRCMSRSDANNKLKISNVLHRYESIHAPTLINILLLLFRMLRYNLNIYFFTNIKNGYTIIIPFVTSLCCMSICIQRRPEGSAMICCNVHIHPCICHRRISYMNPDLKTILTLPQIACEHFYFLTVQRRGRRKKLAFVLLHNFISCKKHYHEHKRIQQSPNHKGQT